LIREKNPFGEVCGITCAADHFCQQDCARREFAGKPVRIADLQRWVCAETGKDGWINSGGIQSGPQVAVVGGGPSALSCAFYLALGGCRVTVFAPEDRPGGKLWEKSTSDPLLRAAVERDVQGVLSSGIVFQGGQSLGINLDLKVVLENYAAVYLAQAGSADSREINPEKPGISGRSSLDSPSPLAAGQSRVFSGEEFLMNGVTVVEAAAGGRSAAVAILQSL